MDTNPIPPQKKGLSTVAKFGIGCGGFALLIVIGMIVAGFLLGGKLMQFGEEMQKNPARTTANLLVKASLGTMEMVAEDDAKQRYTLKNTNTGELTTIYWNEDTKSPETITGDFSAIPLKPEVQPTLEPLHSP